MYVLEFPAEIWENEILVKYIEVDDNREPAKCGWCNIKMDLETLNLLIQNCGMQSIYKMPNQRGNCDNGTLSHEVRIKYCGAEIDLYCENNILEWFRKKM